MHKLVPIILLLLASKSWQSDPQWVRTRYGAWGGPGVNAAPGLMDGLALKDYAPKASLVVPEISVPKAKYPVIDVHSHVVAKTPAEVSEWVRTTMDEVGVEMSVVLTGATAEQFDKLVELYLKLGPHMKTF